MKTLVKIAMGLVAASAFTLSFQSLMELGQLAGYGVLAFLYPVTVDLGTVSSCAAWLATRSRQAFWMTWILLSISVVQNGTVHWLIATGERPEWWLITLVATVPPATLGLVVHLAVGLGGRTAVPVVAVEPSNEPVRGDDTTETVSETDRVAELVAAGAGRRKISRELAISEHQARQLLAERRNGHEVLR